MGDLSATENHGRASGPGAQLARIALLVLASGMAAQLAFNTAMAWQGAQYPYTWFGFYGDDRWADFFKLVFAYPGDAIHAPLRPWAAQPLIDHLHEQADYYRGSTINPDHMPPVETLLALLARRGFSAMDPFLLFQALLWVAMLSLVLAVAAFRAAGEWRWVVATLLSYPLWFMFDRAHFFSLICAASLLGGCRRLMAAEGRFDPAAILLLALACNMRPNVVLLPALLVLSGRAGRLRDLVALGLAGAVMLELAMLAA